MTDETTETTFTVHTWKTAQLTGIVIKRTPEFMGCVIVPCTETTTGATHWNRFDHQLMKWQYNVSRSEIIREVDAAFADADEEVRILLHDLATTDTGQFDPYSV